MGWAGDIIEYYCPKCGSYDVVIEVEKTETKIVRKSLDEWRDTPLISIIPAVLHYTKYIGICKKCGYKVEKDYPF